MLEKPQTEQKHPDEWQRDLNPDHLEGQNIGLEGQNIGPQTSGSEQMGRTAHDVKPVNRMLSEFTDDDLKRIPVLPPGARLQQGGTYRDLAASDRRELTATGEMEANADHAYVPKSEVPYPLWNRLIGVENPERR
ncbi:MAG: hypothetical protein H0X65_18520 [Gemmatimonadetes bacterium]|nr:hypothetical protein [Gemmatimonadota bacterium]